jgi:hypothetical protein
MPEFNWISGPDNSFSLEEPGHGRYYIHRPRKSKGSPFRAFLDGSRTIHRGETAEECKKSVEDFLTVKRQQASNG